jgi:hypothetical protein
MEHTEGGEMLETETKGEKLERRAGLSATRLTSKLPLEAAR